MDRAKCPLHEDVIAAQFTYEQNFITIDVVDGLNTFNIPGEIIKSLKAYHTYLNNEFSGVPIDNGKQQKMLNKFLTEFNKMVSGCSWINYNVIDKTDTRVYCRTEMYKKF